MMKMCSIDEEALKTLFIVACRVKAQEGTYKELKYALFKARLSLDYAASTKELDMRKEMQAVGFSQRVIEQTISLECKD